MMSIVKIKLFYLIRKSKKMINFKEESDEYNDSDISKSIVLHYDIDSDANSGDYSKMTTIIDDFKGKEQTESVYVVKSSIEHISQKIQKQDFSPKSKIFCIYFKDGKMYSRKFKT